MLSMLTLSCAKDKNSDSATIEAIYKTVIEVELQKDSLLGVFDQSGNNTYLDLKGFTSLYDNRDTIIHLEASSFKNIKLYNSDSLRIYGHIPNKKHKSLKEFMPSYKLGQLMSISIPFFNEDKSKAVIEVSLMNPINESFHSRFYVLEKKEGIYVIINKRTLDSSGTVIPETELPD